MAWWKDGSQSDQPIHDVNSNVNSGGLYKTQPEPAYTTEPTPVLIPTTSVLDSISPVSKARPTDCQTVQRPLFKIGGITIKNNLNEFVRVSVQVRFIKRIHPF